MWGQPSSAVRLAKRGGLGGPSREKGSIRAATKTNRVPTPCGGNPVSPLPPATGGVKSSDQFLISPLACFSSIPDLSGLCLEFVKILLSQARSFP